MPIPSAIPAVVAANVAANNGHFNANFNLTPLIVVALLSFAVIGLTVFLEYMEDIKDLKEKDDGKDNSH